MTGEGGHNRNWVCGCKPGILGPPVSPLPPLLLATIEQLGHGPPLSWKLSQNTLQTNLALKWTMNTGQSPNRTTLMPPSLMTAVAMLHSSPESWSLEQENNLLLCNVTWNTASTSPPSTPGVPNLNDSGYSSPPQSPAASPTSPRSPNLSPIQLDLSTAIQTTRQPSAEKPSTTTIASQTPTATTTGTGVQTSAVTSKLYQDAATTTSGSFTTSTTSQTTSSTSDTSTQATPPQTLICSTGTQATLTSTPPAPHKSKKKKNRGKLSTTPPLYKDAETSHDPPTASYRHCRLCHDPNFDETTAASHLLVCQELPSHLLQHRNAFLQQQSSLTGIPIESLQTQTALFLTTHAVDDPDPRCLHSNKDYLIGQLFLSAIDELEQVERYHSDLSKFLRNLDTATLKHLRLDLTADLQHHLFYLPGIDHLPEHDEDDLNLIHHDFDLLDLSHDDESFHADDDYNEYDEEEF